MRQDERARYLVLRVTVKDKPSWVIFHAIFYKEGGFWYGECLETDSVLVYDRSWARVQWKLADAMFGDIQFAHNHGFLDEAYRKPSRTKLAMWRSLRKVEGLPSKTPDPEKLSYKEIYPSASKRGTARRQAPPFIPISTSPGYAYAQ